MFSSSGIMIVSAMFSTFTMIAKAESAAIAR